MQRVCVLEQTFGNEGHSPRGGTVSDVSAWLDELDGVRCQAAGDVLLLLGISETVLAAARAVLRARWGARLRLGPLRVRYAGFPLREPVMDCSSWSRRRSASPSGASCAGAMPASSSRR